MIKSTEECKNVTVKLYNEAHSTPISGTLDQANFDKLTVTAQTEQGHSYLQNSNRWLLTSGSVYSLKDGNSVLNCDYNIPAVGESANLSEVECRFNKVDSDELECYRFYIQRNNPAVVKKEGPYECSED